MENESGKDRWDKAKIIVTIVATVAVPIILGVYGHYIQRTIADKGVSAQLVSLSVNVLAQEPAENKIHLRTWAARIIRKHSDVPLSDKAACLLIYNETYAGFELGDGSNGDRWNHNVISADTPIDPDAPQDPDAHLAKRPIFKEMKSEKED